jgi:ComF family protein
VAFGAYEQELREMIHLLKYARMRPVAARLGRWLGDVLAALPDLPQELTVVPVPLHRRRQRGRGFNHAEAIARATAARLRALSSGRVLTVHPGALMRVRDTASQFTLTPRQRRQNVAGAFAAAPSARLAGRQVLLIDDIYTTGATARAASKALLAAGATAVIVATVARAQREGIALWDANFDREGQVAADGAGLTTDWHG